MTNTKENIFSVIDSQYQANLAKLTAGVSPAAVKAEISAWINQLMISPGKVMELMSYPALHAQEALQRLVDENGPGCGKDLRFNSERWKMWPWRFYAASFLSMEDFYQAATTGVPGLEDRTSRSIAFLTRQLLDAFAPINFPMTNPDVINESIRTSGSNWITGFKNFYDDMLRMQSGAAPAGTENYAPGKNLAVTPGKVVYRTHLMEVIQFSPTTETVYKEPVLILPAWIMKYYILDLSAKNSLVRWLVEQGHTVFIGSWRNPDESDRDVCFDDYYRQGAMAAIDAVSTIVPNTKIHLVGYCLGGTLAMLTASAMAGKGDDRLQSMTAFAAQGDFTEAGELLLFVNESKISFIEQLTKAQGYLDTKQMANTFHALRSYDMIWSKIVSEYMMGRREKMIDLMAWNADATRLPHKMYCEYLEKLFLHNDFVEGRMLLDGKPIAPENIKVPVFAVGTEKDHVVPWRSAHKIHLMVPSSVTFALANSGHNAGIVSEPGHKGRYYRIHERKAGDPYLSPESWLEVAELHKEESWWLAWEKWLVKNSSPDRVKPPSIGTTLAPYQPIADAPGTYVLQK